MMFVEVVRVLASMMLLFTCVSSQDRRQFYRAAIYEHAPIAAQESKGPLSRKDALDAIMRNLKVYENQTKEAAKQKADIIVFPEDGFHEGAQNSRAEMTPFLEFIPDPLSVTWTPCDEPEKYPDTEVQGFLSCLAKYNSIYVVANMGDKQPCDKQNDPRCPSDGHYQFNTNVVYDKKGTLVARYHKLNLFYEFYYDIPATPQYSYFDTPFGRFGTFTCFDILFEEPTIPLIERYNIKNIVYPTAWYDDLPLFGAVQFQAAFAYGLGINVLSSNLHIVDEQYHGSSIISPAANPVIYFDSTTDEGKLLVTDVMSNPVEHKPNDRRVRRVMDRTGFNVSQHTAKHTRGKDEFVSKLYEDPFHFLPLTKNSGKLDICHNDLCCHLDYKKADTTDFFAFGVFDGLHTYEGTYYIQVCVLLKCASHTRNSCGSPTTMSATMFDHFTLFGTFDGPYVYPITQLTDQGQLRLPQKDQWTHNTTTLTGGNFKHPLLSAALFRRIYERDD